MTALRDLLDLRDDLELAGGLPAWREPSTVIGRQAQKLARALRDRWVKAELAATTVRAEIAKHAAEVDAQRATNERLTAEIDRLRALPVLRTCETCRWCDVGPTAPSGPGEPRRRLHDYCSQNGRVTDAKALPPEWCRLRGAR